MRHVLFAFFVVVLALQATGCPPRSPIVLGTWLLTFEDNSAAAIILLQDGATDLPDPRPPQADSDFEQDFVFLWAVNGSTFTLSQYPDTGQPSDAEVVATGNVASRRFINNGTLEDSDATWTARPL